MTNVSQISVCTRIPTDPLHVNKKYYLGCVLKYNEVGRYTSSIKIPISDDVVEANRIYSAICDLLVEGCTTTVVDLDVTTSASTTASRKD